MAPTRKLTKKSEDAIVARALAILEARLRRDPITLDRPAAVRDYCAIRLAGYPHEVFGVLFLDQQNRLIEYVELFRGTLTQTSVYPREVLKEALLRNAARVILTHNHPSGIAEPSRADQLLTQELRAALKFIDVDVVDHIIAAGGKSLSFAERGLL